MTDSLYPKSPYNMDRGEFPPRLDVPDGRLRIREERERQIKQEGYDLDHDMDHPVQELVDAANCYLYEVDYFDDGSLATHGAPSTWPWNPKAFKPTTRLRDLEKAGALYRAAADMMMQASENVADLIDREIAEGLKKAGLV